MIATHFCIYENFSVCFTSFQLTYCSQRAQQTNKTVPGCLHQHKLMNNTHQYCHPVDVHWNTMPRNKVCVCVWVGGRGGGPVATAYKMGRLAVWSIRVRNSQMDFNFTKIKAITHHLTRTATMAYLSSSAKQGAFTFIVLIAYFCKPAV